MHAESHIAQTPKLGCTSLKIASVHKFDSGAPGNAAGIAGALAGATHTGKLDDTDVSANLHDEHVDLRHAPRYHSWHATFVQMPLSAWDC